MPEIFFCGVEAAPVRAEPDHTAEQVTQALRGEPLAVEERRAGWARIRTAYDYPGWFEEAALARATVDVEHSPENADRSALPDEPGKTRTLRVSA